MSKVKVLGEEYGIEITRPWSPEMYDHNDKVSETMKQAIQVVLDRAYTDEDDYELAKIAKIICGYGFGSGHDLVTIYEDACRELGMIQNWWLDSDVWPDMVHEGFVKDLDVKFVGFKK